MNNGGQAFPQSAVYDGGRNEVNPASAYMDAGGMSLRDYFAAKAMQGIIGKIAFDQPSEDMIMKAGIDPADFERFAAELSYSMADAMLKQREVQDEVL